MFESSGPEGKIRGSAYQVIDKYQALARDALAAGDRIAAENYLQHAEHYYRVLAANGMEPRPNRFQGEGEEEGGAPGGSGGGGDPRDPQPRNDQDGQPVN